MTVPGFRTYASLTAAFIVCGALLAFCGMDPAAAADRAELRKIAAQMLAPVVQLNRNCSASIIYSNRDEKSGKVETLVLTAKHCVDADGLIQTVHVPVYESNRLVREGAYKAVVVGKDWRSDLALLKLQDTTTYFAEVARLAPEDVELIEGEDVWSVGYSRGEIRTITEGLFGARTSIPFPVSTKDTEYFRATAQIAGGNSGGLLFHKTDAGDYELIGVTSAGMQGSDFMAYYTAVNAIREYLKTIAPQMFKKDGVAAAGAPPKAL